ncbi:APC family permease [Kineosporia sp. A_224]|uniref:APC family permease n=1 Tax=Kineosporia sp. A_224 TaxID=1962180 RepID=UPI000B4B1C60|nr:APC family permease [Kineosporia sp. A_224]
MTAAALPPDVIETTTTAALEEKAKLKRHFGRFDIFFFLICTIVGLDTLGAVSNYGAQAFVWLIFLSVFFFVPYALLTAELGSAFREEGGSYIWTKLSMGRFAAGLNAVLYWLSNPIWLGGALVITALAVFDEFYFELGHVGAYIFALAFIWFATWAAILSFGVGKWIPTIGAWGRIVLLSGFTITVFIYAAQNGVGGVSVGDFKPTWAVFIAAVPVLFFNFVGFELPNAAGDEMKDAQKDVPYTVKRATIVAILAYGLPILAILLVVPAQQITSLDGFVSAIKLVFTVYGGSVEAAADGTLTPTLTGAGAVLGGIAAAGFIWALLSSGTTWIMGADRAQAVAAYDGAGPRWLGTFSERWGTPIAVNLASGVFSTVTFVAAYELTQGDAAKYFVAALGLAISTTTISYLSIFPSLYLLRKKHPHVHRPYRVPGGDGVALGVSVLCTLWAALASLSLLWPGFATSLDVSTWNDSLPEEFAGQRLQYELSQLVPLALFIGLGVLFYILGAPTRRKQVQINIETEEVVADR